VTRRKVVIVAVLIEWITARVGEPQDQVVDGDLHSVERRTPP